MTAIRVLSATDLLASRAAFNELLLDSVDGGASVGFLPPIDAEIADKYWLGVEAAVRMGSVILLGAYDTNKLIGSVQVSLAHQANGTHRGEVMKLLVHSGARRKGIGTQLMRAAEQEAVSRGRCLLILDTERGSAAEQLYRHLAWHALGVIPRYALSGDRTLRDTVFFFKELAAP